MFKVNEKNGGGGRGGHERHIFDLNHLRVNDIWAILHCTRVVRYYEVII